MVSAASHSIFLLLVLAGACASGQSPEPVKVETPANTTKITPLTDSSNFIIIMKDDNTVWWRLGEGNPASAKKIEEPVRANLSQLIGDFKKQRQHRLFLIQGGPKTKYDVFEKVIGALRDNEE